MSSGGSKTQQVNSVSAPWSGQQPFLSDVFTRAQNQFNAGPYSYFPNSTVVPFSNQTEQALGRLENVANDPNSLTRQAQGQLGATLGGDYLSAGNPYFGAMMDRVSNQIRPRLDAQFGGANYGGSLHQGAMASALTDAASNLAFQNYGQERQNQLQAMAAAPQMATADIDPLVRVGQMREDLASRELQDQISRFNFNQAAPDEALRRYASLVAGGQWGGSQTTQQPIYSNPLAQGLGYAATATNIAGNLFGPRGLFR
jgi:hypothetical protein